MLGTQVNPARKLLSGNICLEFTNTVAWHSSDNPEERLKSYADLITWSTKVGLLTHIEGKRLLEEAGQHQDEARNVFQKAITLREGIYRIFARTAHGLQPEKADLQILNDMLATALSRLRIVSSDKGFVWEWLPCCDISDDLGHMLWQIAKSAGELLTSEELGRVRQCANEIESCGWLFLDETKNRSRRWCDMGDCGNRMKARRYYERKHAKNK